MFGKILQRLPHWTPAKHPRKKLRYNPQLNIKKPETFPPRHDYIVFTNYTGNEILYNLKHVAELRPSEMSSALLELGVRKGAPEGYDWNEHPMVQLTVDYARKRIPQYDSRVLTSLAHAFHRLQIRDTVLWENLGKHIIRTSSKIEPIGIAYSFDSFIGKNMPKFYADLLDIVQLHIRYMNGRDYLHIVRGLVMENIDADELFARWLYPLIIEKKKMCSAKQLEEFISLLSRRKDFTSENKVLLEEALEYKIKRAEWLSKPRYAVEASL